MLYPAELRGHGHQLIVEIMLVEPQKVSIGVRCGCLDR